MDDLPKVQPSQYSLPPTNGGNQSEMSVHKKSYKTTRESSMLSNSKSGVALSRVAYGVCVDVPQKHQSDFNLYSPKNGVAPGEGDFNRQLPQISPRTSQLDSFLNHGMKPRRAPKNSANDFSIFYGKAAVEEAPKEAQLRIRGKSNIVQTQEGSLLHSIYEQRQEQEREKQLAHAK